MKGNRAQGNLFCARESPRGSAIAADAAAIVGGKIAHSTVSEQLAQERIDVPCQGGVEALKDKESQEALRPYVGRRLTTGPRAKAFADHCIRQHMLEASGGAAPAEADKAGQVRRRGVS